MIAWANVLAANDLAPYHKSQYQTTSSHLQIHNNLLPSSAIHHAGLLLAAKGAINSCAEESGGGKSCCICSRLV